MIIRETEHEITMVRQHDHAQLSGDVARNFKNYFINDPFFDDLIFAVYQHDLGWIRLDATPIWNDRNSVPFSFIDYPLLPKLTHYTYGLDQIERMNKYAGLLCSLHYSSFGIFQNSTIEECSDFSNNELQRQQRIITELDLTNHNDIFKQFKLLQLCDVISLYVCLNCPGVSKEQEHPRYRTGFEDSELFNNQSNGRLVAEWMNNKEIKITPNPFDKGFSTNLLQKNLSKKLIKEHGIEKAYKNSEWVNQEIIFVGRS
ncbi:DUF3891 family protein [Paenibacillus radicis (ex Xue et al. 2023)]|uniref:DUF3891 family protein n=1 Tax=Paenibacillus radicis (ex Xue et al. 2023) TaxID=2972489 RepID=A0ABT1YBR8_9BACL|nr:DUF3891 family protein [Paenibacillus radicis (ex Xue et al. 2023)]MCR8630637.1 DUF3891 family protein [Paenibacillus radicis (ex Xue et al. 2023)]